MPIQLDELERLIGEPHVGPIPPFCSDCGYNLTGAVSHRCPECGNSFSTKEWKRQAWETLRRVQEIKEANDWARWGTWIALGGAGSLLVCLLARGVCIVGPLLVCAALAGFTGMVLGLGVFRIPRLPSWTADDFAPPRNYAFALAAMFVGAGVAAGGVLILLK